MTQADMNKFFFHPLVSKTYKRHLELTKNDFRPYLNYFGMNFDSEGISSFKFYFPFFRRLKKEEIELFIPHSEDFMRYYHLWDESDFRSLEHSGCTFEVKFNRHLTPILGFHFRLRPTSEAYKLIGLPQLLPFKINDLTTRPGINYEYSQGQVLRKKYYYFDSSDHKIYFANRFNNPFISRVNTIEYTESNDFSKINAWRFDHTPENINRPNVHSDYANQLFDYLNKKYNLINLSDGYYENQSIRASYFFNVINSSPSPFDDEVNYNIDTLKLFIDVS
jgi:hypothetical protein